MIRMLALAAASAALWAQVPNPTQNTSTPVSTGGSVPIFRATVVERTTKAVNYRHRSGWTKVDFRGTALMPQARGEANVNSRKGYIEAKVSTKHMDQPSKFGPEFLTYVLWAITPEGRAMNLGEVVLDNLQDHTGKLDVTTELQAFGLIVTAEPYFAVQQPSDVVVMENVIRPDTLGAIEEIDAKYELLQRGQYTLNVNPGMVHPIILRGDEPLELAEARNAVQIARWTGADKYAPDVFQKAAASLQQAEDYQARKAGRKPVIMTARAAAQVSEDAREITIKRIQEEQLARERQEAADREQQARLKAQQEAQQRAAAEEQQRIEAQRRLAAEADRLAAERAKADADRARAQAEAATQRAQQERAAADAARAQAEQARLQMSAEADRARQAAEEADRLRQQAVQDKEALRQQLLQQFNMILETRDTARGLIVNMSDVLFDTGKYTLRQGAREKLAKVAGIVLAHPGLRLEVEGHTDSVGGDEYNQRLSEQRANAVRDYLVAEGLNSANVTSRGFGKTMPVASNDTAAGRQQNRRVELVVSGEVIGTQIGGSTVPASPR